MREIQQEHFDQAVEAVTARGERMTIEAMRAELKRQGFTDRQLRVQGFDRFNLPKLERTATRVQVEILPDHDDVNTNLRTAKQIAFALVVVLVTWIGFAAWLAAR